MAKKKNLRQMLANREVIQWDQNLIKDLTLDEILSLLENWNRNRDNPQSIGYQFVSAVESVFREGIVLETQDGTFDATASADHAVQVINLRSTAKDGIVTVGTRRRQKTFYVFTLSEHEKVEAPRDPMSPHHVAVDDGYSQKPYEVEFYTEDGSPKVDLNVQALVALAWETREFPDASLQANVATQLGPNTQPEQLHMWIPLAFQQWQKEKRQLRGRWDQRLADLLTVKEAPPTSENFSMRMEPSAREIFQNWPKEKARLLENHELLPICKFFNEKFSWAELDEFCAEITGEKASDLVMVVQGAKKEHLVRDLIRHWNRRGKAQAFAVAAGMPESGEKNVTINIY